MVRQLPTHLVDEAALNAIRCTVRDAIRRRWFPVSDFEDLTQDIVVQLLNKLEGFNPTRSSWPTFCTIVARSFLSTESIRRQKRVNPDSLHDKESTDSTARHEDSVEHHHSFGRYFTRKRSRNERFELHEDVADVVSGLPDPLRNFCEAYLQEESLSKVAGMLGISRNTVYRQREIVRERISDVLHEYQYED